MSKVIHFEFGADKPERAIKFYEDVFQWKITKYPGTVDYWPIKAGTEDEIGINGAIAPRQKYWNISNSVAVHSVDEYLERIEMHGGEALTEKAVVPKMGYMAYFKDTEGNTLSILKPIRTPNSLNPEFKNLSWS